MILEKKLSYSFINPFLGLTSPGRYPMGQNKKKTFHYMEQKPQKQRET